MDENSNMKPKHILSEENTTLKPNPAPYLVPYILVYKSTRV